MFVICLAAILLFAAIQTKASDTTTEDIKLVTIENYTSDKLQTEIGNQREAGYLYAGLYKSGTTTVDELVARNVVVNPNNDETSTYVAKFVPEGVMGIRAQVSSSLLSNPNAENSSIRFVTAIDSVLYREVGFSITRVGDDGEPFELVIPENVTNYVYEQLYGVDVTSSNPGEPMEYTPKDIHALAKYFKTYTITNVPANAFNTDLTVIPYWVTHDGVTVEGTGVIKSVNFGRSWVYVNTSANSDNLEYGTYSHPFTNLADAIDAIVLDNDGKIIIQNNCSMSVASDFEWTQRGKDFTITGEGVQTETLDFSNVADLVIGDSVTFANMTLKFKGTSVNSTGKVHANGNRFKIAEDVISNNPYTNIMGGGYNADVTGDTSVTLLAGSYCSIYGGGRTGDVSGSTYVEIRNANVYNDTKDKARVFGGGYKGNVEGDVRVIIGDGFNKDLTDNCIDDKVSAVYGGGFGDASVSGIVKGNTYVVIGDENNTEGTAKVNYVYGGGYNYSEVWGTCHVTMYNGSAKSIQGGACGTGTNSNTSVVMNGGYTEQIFGGNGAGMTGNTYVEIAGGEVSRRVYGGCYNNYEIFSGGWQSENSVTGYATVNITDKDALTFDYEDTSDSSLVAGSRCSENKTGEIGVLVFSHDLYDTYQNNVGCSGTTANICSNLKPYHYLVDASTGGTVYSEGSRLRVIPDKINEVYNNASVRVSNGITDVIHAYITSEGLCALPTLDATTNQREVYVVFSSETPTDVALANYEAKVGGTHFDTLENAIAEAKTISTADRTAVVTLLQDVAIESVISVSESDNITIQSEGDSTYTIAAPSTATTAEQNVFSVSGTLTINNVSMTGGYRGIQVSANGKLYSDEGVSISGVTDQGLNVSNGTVEMSGLTVSGTKKQALLFQNSKTKARISNYTVHGDGSFVAVRVMNGADVTLTDGTIHANKTYGIYMDGSSTKVTTTDTKVVRGANNTTDPLVGIASATSEFTFNENESGEAYIDGQSYGGRGVDVYGTFILNGGTIRNNNFTGTDDDNMGAGIIVREGATFTMTGGTISGNTAAGKGGGVYVTASTFTMTGGTISGNTAADTTSGGGGVCVAENGTFNMNAPEIEGVAAGIIKENVAAKYGAGVLVYGTFNMNAGTISNHGSSTSNRLAVEGTGVCLSGTSATFNMNGGEISNNYASSPGAGVSMLGGDATYPVFTMTGGSITGNDTSGAAAGIIVRTGEVTMTGGTISNNTAGGNGGGAYVTSKFTMAGGTISTNTANKSDGGGGGVYVNDNGTFTMSSGTISQNTTANYGGGVYVKTNGIFNMNAPESEGVLASEIKANVTASSKYGAGVFVQGTFTMNAGAISDHGSKETPLAVEGTAVCLSGTKANFTMNGGQISSNYASSAGAGVSMRGGNTSYPQFTMNGGQITENHTTGNVGGIVVRTGTFTMNDGAIISNNTATKLAGGMSLETADKTTFIFNGGTFENNSAGNRGDDIYLTGQISLKKALTDNISISPASYTEATVVATNGGVSDEDFRASLKCILVEPTTESAWFVNEESGNGILCKGPFALTLAGVGYATLDEAVTAATAGETITIYRDATITNQITKELTLTSDKAVTITADADLNKTMFSVGASKTLTITGAALDKKINIVGVTGQNVIGSSGTINFTNVSINGGRRGIYVGAGTVNLTGVQISNSTDEGLRIDAKASVIASGLNVSGTGKQGLYFNGTDADNKTTATISNFEVSGTGGAAVRLMNYCDVTLVDGTITTGTYCIATSDTSKLTTSNVSVKTTGNVAALSIAGTKEGDDIIILE